MPRGRGEDGSENQEGEVSFGTLRDEGQHFVHVQQYQKAIESFTKALELKPDDQHCLVTRSKCYLQVGNAEASLADAENALEQNKALIKGLFQKAEALYQKADFETALMYYHRGHRLRPELQEFRLGIQKCQEAINNSIGTPEAVKLEANKGDMSYFYKQEEAKKQQRGAYQKPNVKKEEKKDRDIPKGPGDKKTIKQLLGELYGDKEYLEKLLKDQSLTGKNNRNDMSREIKDKVCDGLEYLYSRADFWGQQKPIYSRKQAKIGTGAGSSSKPMDVILRNLESIDDAQSDGKYNDSLDLAKKTLKMVESSSDDKVQNKPELTASLHSSIGNAYLELGKLNQAQEHHEKDLEIAKENDLEDAKSRALDNLGRVYARKGEYEKAIEVWQEKIPSSKSALESTWLYHEIGRCYLELGRHSDARDYGEKSLAAANEAEDDGWQLHACVLVAQSEVKLGDYQAAAESFEKSLDLAKKQNDTAAESAITRALEEVNDKLVKGTKEGDEQEEGDDEQLDQADKEEKEQDLESPKGSQSHVEVEQENEQDNEPENEQQENEQTGQTNRSDDEQQKDKKDKPDKNDKDKPDKPDKNDKDKPDKPGKNDKDKPDKPDKPGKNDKDKPDKPGQNDKDKPDKPGQNDKDKPDQSQQKKDDRASPDQN